MANTTNLNIRMDKSVKEQAEAVFNELGLSMTSAITVFLKTAIRERGIPFRITLNTPNAETIAAIEEGRKIAYDQDVKGYKTMDELKVALHK